ncbi:hypothetical protein [Duganella radicis]|uniref:Uncharacterized protein n=1 Tax=Duganella radicis TaxID=551988 RepID=A0A6L6PCG3_9BURK|nr:hypothetical protein [Duganella radicis]MTV36281.1 hypothetical protein [Duganella radicis]
MQYDFKLSGNGGMQIDVQGSFIKYKSGTGAIRVVTSKGGYIDLLPGQGVWGVDFTRLTVQDRSGNANTGVLLAGAYDFRDQTIPGTVSVADGGMNWTNNLNCFMGSASAIANAGTHNIAALANPAGNTKNVVVKSVKCSSVSGTYLTLFLALYTPAGNTKALNKKGGGAVSSAVLDAAQLASVAAFGNPLAMHFDNVNGTPRDVVFQEPVVIPPGYALIYRPGNTTGGAGDITFDFREEVI